tara:strand:- start:7043 stop:8059 length:1017 start_codon:yes stop_codon:yes gene_type:complete
MKNDLKKSNIVVTGADGFIGSHLTETLAKMGCNVTAYAMYNSLNSWGWLDTINKKVLSNIKVVSGDIRDPRSVNSLCKKSDYIFHLASLIAIPHSYASPYSYLDTNALGTLNILEYCRENGIKQLIHTSTSEVYGDFDTIPINENNSIIAKSPYAATKIAADQLAYSYFSSYDVPVSIIRPFNTFGPRQSNRAIIPTIITQLLNKNKSIKLGSLYPTRDFTYVKDTVQGFISIASSKKSIGETINIGSGYEISIGDLYTLIESIIKSDMKFKQEKSRVRPKEGEVNRLRADNKKAKRILSWSPDYSGKNGLKKALRETIAWFSDRDNLKLYKSNFYNT